MITTNILFFDKTGATERIDYYDIPLPEGYKSFSKTKPFKSIHLDGVRKWMNSNEVAEKREADENVYSVYINDIKNNNYNLDFKNPNKINEEYELSLAELLNDLDNRSNTINSLVSKLNEALQEVEE